MKRFVRLVMIVLCTFSIQACIATKFPQWQVLAGVLKTLSDEGVETDPEKNEWSARVGAEGRLVTVFKQDQFYVFVADDGNAIAFDGWNVRSIIGFGASDVRVVTVRGEQKQFTNGSFISSTYCSGWHLKADRSDGVSKVWVQECDGQIRANVIVVDGAGAISEINQVIDADGSRAVLKRI